MGSPLCIRAQPLPLYNWAIDFLGRGSLSEGKRESRRQEWQIKVGWLVAGKEGEMGEASGAAREGKEKKIVGKVKSDVLSKSLWLSGLLYTIILL